MPNKLQKALFMLKKLHRDLRRERQVFELSEDLHSRQLGEYYFIMTEDKLLSGYSQQFHFDEEGIPIIPAYIDVEEQKLIYYPISIGQYGLAIWNTFLKTGSEADKRRFLKIADWFWENRREDERLGAYWLTDVDKPAYRIQRPWKSSFSQARAINILMRAYQLTGKAEYEEIAEKALQPFLYAVEDGGVTTFLPEGPFYEEYPSSGEPVLVLNGMVFALCGIYDFLRTHPGHRMVKEIFDKGVRTLKHLLPQYDIGFWTQYCLCKANFHPEVDPSTIFYHYLHIVQLELMHKLTGIATFKEYARKWEAYISPGNILKMYRMKYKALKKLHRL